MSEVIHVLKPWSSYYEAHRGRPPFRLLEEAIAHVPDKVSALDLGAGPLNESRALLDAGFARVVAVDRERQVAEFAKQLGDPRLVAETVSFADYAYPKETFSLVVASKALPFAGKALSQVVAGVGRSLKLGGIFVGNLFGVRHAFKNNISLAFCTTEQAHALLADMRVLRFEEVEKDEQTSTGPMHWHGFDFIAQKK